MLKLEDRYVLPYIQKARQQILLFVNNSSVRNNVFFFVITFMVAGKLYRQQILLIKISFTN